MLLNIIKFFKSIIETYPTFTFKIVDINGEPKHKNTEITYQVSGKSTVTTEKPILLIKELMQIKGFSKKDSELIYHLALNEEMINSFRILSIHLKS